MKVVLKSLILVFLSLSIDIKAQEIYGDWIKTKITYLDGCEMPDDNPLKNKYLRYTLEEMGKLFISFDFGDKGTAFSFNINSSVLNVSNMNGFLVNSFFIDQLTDHEMVLIQKGENGFNGPDCIKLFFIKEGTYQKGLSLKASDILCINSGDTVYKSSEKIHPRFSGDKSFSDFSRAYLPEVNGAGYFLSTFIIRKDGTIDSVMIIENINGQFEKQFRKALEKSKSLWRPAELDGRKVDVQVKAEYKYYTSMQMIPMYDYSNKGKQAMDEHDYARALFCFDLALKSVPEDYEVIYYKAICELNLGNREAACEDLQRVKESGKMNVDELIKQNCGQ